MKQEPIDAVKIRDAMQRHKVEYLVIGKMAAILQGFRTQRKIQTSSLKTLKKTTQSFSMH